MTGRHSIRIPIHGFVELDDWEWEVLQHPVFQRLRRIRQLAFSEHIYPGSTHTRFEHSLGVMHVATRMFDVLRRKHEAQLVSQYGFDAAFFERCRALVRLAALLHDVGHAPLSHSGEDLMPRVQGQKLDHEDYSYWLIREEMKDVIDDNNLNRERLRITGEEVASFYLGRATVSPKLLLWRDLVSGQLDADRMDYLLRDAHHCGVTYGNYDLGRLLDTLVFVEDVREGTTALRIGIEDGGRHAAEGLILARYFMFEQVYFQKTRLAYDHHASACLRSSLSSAALLPDPTKPSGRRKYLTMDDWYLFRYIRGAATKDRHANAILNHEHDREVFRTAEVAGPDQLKQHDDILKRLRKKGIDAWSADASKSWYKTGRAELLIAERDTKPNEFARARPLTQLSETAGKVRDSLQHRIFVPLADRDQAKELLKGLSHGRA